MKKITLLIAALLTGTLAMAQTTPTTLRWEGTENNIWNAAEPNWMNAAEPFFPETFAEGSIALFSTPTEAGIRDTVKVDGEIITSGVRVNAATNYVIKRTADTDLIGGTGSLIKEGKGTFFMDVKNALTEGTIVREGRIAMESWNSPDIFGSKLVLDGGTANFGNDNSKTSEVSVPMEITEKGGSVELGRYSKWSSSLKGSGDLTLYVGGERTYLGADKSKPVDWSEYAGTNVTVEKLEKEGITPGFYGLLLNSDKTFKADTLVYGAGIDSTFYNRKLHLGSGVSLVSESGTRCYAIGELSGTDETNSIAGYYKKSTGPDIYYMVGGLNTDVTFPGIFADYGNKGYNKVGLIKIGTGTYKFTGKNAMSGTTGVTVKEGRFLVDVADEAGFSALGRSKGNILNIAEKAIGGGSGRLVGTVNVEGKLEVGCDGIGSIIVADTSMVAGKFESSGGYNYPLALRPTATAEFEIGTVSNYDNIFVENQARFYVDGEKMPTLKVIPAASYDIKDGDVFTILTSKQKKMQGDAYKIEFPTLEGVTFSATETMDSIDHEAVMNGDIEVTKAYKEYIYKIIVKATGSAHGTNVEHKSVKESISVYPNPSEGEFNIEGAEMSSIEIYNNQGQLVSMESINAASANINLNGMSKGIYYAKIKTTEGKMIVKKLVIR